MKAASNALEFASYSKNMIIDLFNFGNTAIKSALRSGCHKKV